MNHPEDIDLSLVGGFLKIYHVPPQRVTEAIARIPMHVSSLSRLESQAEADFRYFYSDWRTQQT